MDVVSSFPKCEFGFLETIDNIEVSTGGTPSLVGSNGRDQTADIIAADGTKADPVWTIFDGNPQANCTTGGYCFVCGFINSYDSRVLDVASDGNSSSGT